MRIQFLRVCTAIALSVLTFTSVATVNANDGPSIQKLAASSPQVGRPGGQNAVFVDLTFQYAARTADIQSLIVTSVDPAHMSRTGKMENLARFSIGDRMGTGHYRVVYNAQNVTGTYTYTLQLVDVKGQKGNQESVSVVVDDSKIAAIAITAVSPSKAKPGDFVTISGTGFDPRGLNEVSFMGVPAQVKAASTESITCIVPGNARSGTLEVHNAHGVAVFAPGIAVQPIIQIRSAFVPPSLAPLGRVRFFADVLGARDRGVTWLVEGEPGGNDTVGTIAPDGTYTAPAVPPPSDFVTISAISNESKSLVASTTMKLVGPLPQRGTGAVIRTATGAAVSDAAGLIAIKFAPGSPDRDTSLSAVEATFIDPKQRPESLPATTPLTRIVVKASNPDAKAKAGTTTYRVALPRRLPPGTKLSLYSDTDSGLKFSGGAIVDATGLRAEGSFPGSGFGSYIVALDVDEGNLRSIRSTSRRTALAGNQPGTDDLASGFTVVPLLKGGLLPTAYPAIVSAVIGPPSGVEEGETVPVLIEGRNFRAGTTQITIASTTIQRHGVRTPITLGIDSDGNDERLVVGPVLVNSGGTRLGFTLTVPPIVELLQGDLLLVSFDVTQLTMGGTPVSTVETDAALFTVRGLPELDVRPSTNALFTIDGERVDTIVENSARFSRIHVFPNARLGIGYALTRASLGSRPELHAIDLSTLRLFEERFGTLPWAPDPIFDNVQVFEPRMEGVVLDVTGPVLIEGDVYLAGMHGGEGLQGQAVVTGHGAPGGLASSGPSGGNGGDGGISHDSTTQDGQKAGNGIMADGLGHNQFGPEANQAVASEGVRFSPDISVYSFDNSLEVVGLNLLTGFTGGLGLTGLELLQAINTAYTTASVPGTLVQNFSPQPGCISCNPGATFLHVGGGGGPGGTRPSGLGSDLSDDTELSAGYGGGGGGGGGSSLYEQDIGVFGFKFAASVEAHIGGGGGGGGGAAGALRITSGKAIDIKGKINARGGRGGSGQPHVFTASPGGGGGGGTGGLLKLQAPRFLNEGTIDVSGGTRGGGLLLQNTIVDLPTNIQGVFLRMIVMDDPVSRGNVIFYDHYSPALSSLGVHPSPDLTLMFSAGRIRRVTQEPFDAAVVGLANMLFGARGLLIVDSQGSLHWTGLPDFGNGALTGEVLNLGNLLTSLPAGFQITGVAQSPTTHTIYVSGYVGTGFNPSTEIHSFNFLGGYIGRVFQATSIAETSELVGPIRSIDVLTEDPNTPGDKIVALMAIYNASRGGALESGVFRVDPATGTAGLLFQRDWVTSSMSLLRDRSGNPAGDQLALLDINRGAPESGGIRPARLEFVDIFGNGLGRVTISGDTVGQPGEPGLVRIDGALPGSNPPAVVFDGIEDWTTHNEIPSTYLPPVLGSFTGPAIDLGLMETLVFTEPTITVFVQGGNPDDPRLQELSVYVQQTGSAPRITSLPTLDSVGRAQVQITLPVGFSNVWVQVGSSAPHPLLQRRILRL